MAAIRKETFNLLESSVVYSIAHREICSVVISSYSFLLIYIILGKNIFGVTKDSALSLQRAIGEVVQKKNSGYFCQRHTEHINTTRVGEIPSFCVKLAVRIVTAGLFSVPIFCNIFTSSYIVPLMSTV